MNLDIKGRTKKKQIEIVGILFGIIPVLGLLRKTPAQIVSKYDI